MCVCLHACTPVGEVHKDNDWIFCYRYDMHVEIDVHVYGVSQYCNCSYSGMYRLMYSCGAGA